MKLIMSTYKKVLATFFLLINRPAMLIIHPSYVDNATNGAKAASNQIMYGQLVKVSGTETKGEGLIFLALFSKEVKG